MKMLDNRINFYNKYREDNGAYLPIWGKYFQLKSYDDLPVHRVKIAYSFEGESGKNILENRK